MVPKNGIIGAFVSKTLNFRLKSSVSFQLTHVLRHGVAPRQRGDAGHEVGGKERAQHHRPLARGRAHRRVAIKVHRYEDHGHLRDPVGDAARLQHLGKRGFIVNWVFRLFIIGETGFHSSNYFLGRMT